MVVVDFDSLSDDNGSALVFILVLISTIMGIDYMSFKAMIESWIR